MKKLPRMHSLVVMNHKPDATLFRVVEIREQFIVGLIDATIEDTYTFQRVHLMDKSLLKEPDYNYQTLSIRINHDYQRIFY
jgi:hypothetical protein